MKSLPTIYRGIRFRSRLEARWALFFDEMKLPWEWEPQAFRLSTGDCYLPDFRLVVPNREIVSTSEGLIALYGNECVSVFAEVKPANGSFEKALRFRLDGLGAMFFLEGPPPGRVSRDWFGYQYADCFQNLDQRKVFAAAARACSERFGAHP